MRRVTKVWKPIQRRVRGRLPTRLETSDAVQARKWPAIKGFFASFS
jgi:hypothetical protein